MKMPYQRIGVIDVLDESIEHLDHAYAPGNGRALYDIRKAVEETMNDLRYLMENHKFNITSMAPAAVHEVCANALARFDLIVGISEDEEFNPEARS